MAGIVLIVGGMFTSGLINSKPKDSSGLDFPKESLMENQKMMSVDVSGAVAKPGVYQIKDGGRIEDAVKVAGGFTEGADKEYVSK